MAAEEGRNLSNSVVYLVRHALDWELSNQMNDKKNKLPEINKDYPAYFCGPDEILEHMHVYTAEVEPKDREVEEGFPFPEEQAFVAQMSISELVDLGHSVATSEAMWKAFDRILRSEIQGLINARGDKP